MATSPPVNSRNPMLDPANKPKSLILEDNQEFQDSLTKTLGGVLPPKTSNGHHHDHHHDHHHHHKHDHRDSGKNITSKLFPHFALLINLFLSDIDHLNVEPYGLHTKLLYRNAAASILYEQALARETGSALTSTGALVTSSGHKTGTYDTPVIVYMQFIIYFFSCCINCNFTFLSKTCC